MSNLVASLAIILIGFIVYCASLLVKGERGQLSLSCIGGILIGFGFCMIILLNRPTVLDFMRGKVDVNIQETYIDSILVKRDTIITYKNKMPLSCP